MSYADSLLSTGERILRRERQHWLVLLWGARIPIAAIVAALLILGLSGNVTGAARDLLGLLTAVLFLGGLAFLLWSTVRYLNQEYVLTNRRVIEVQGVMNKRSTDSSLEKINDAILTQPIFGRIFGFGDLEVLTASEAGIERFAMIVDPIGFKKAMLDAKHAYEQDMSGSFRAPGPPIRATAAAATEGSVSSGGPMATEAASSSASAPRADPDEITRTVANLADLRDRGAISAEEYESKKADLLGRL
jgi:hypothetical protein